MKWVVGLLLFVFNLSCAFGDELPDQAKIILRHLQSPRAKLRVFAVQALGTYPYPEVKKAILEAVGKELRASVPNPEFIRACFDALFYWAKPEDVGALKKMRPQVEDITLRAAALDGASRAPLENVICAAEKRDPNAPMEKIREAEKFFGQEEGPPQTERTAEYLVVPSPVSVSPHPARAQISFEQFVKTLLHTNDRFDARLSDAVVTHQLSADIAKTIELGTETCTSDEVAAEDIPDAEPLSLSSLGEEILETWSSLLPMIPVVVGPTGVGKSTTIRQLVRVLSLKSYPDWHIYGERFSKETIFLRTRPDILSKLAPPPYSTDAAQISAIESYLRAVMATQKVLGVNIVVYIDGIDGLSKSQLAALKAHIDQPNHVLILGEARQQAYNLKIQGDQAVSDSFHAVVLAEPTREQTTELMGTDGSWVEKISKKYRVTVSEDVLETITKVAEELYPNLARPKAQIRFLEGLAASVSRRDKPTIKQPVPITVSDCYDFLSRVTGLPIDPSNPKKFIEFVEWVRAEAKKIVVGQDHVIDMLVDLTAQAITAPGEESVGSLGIIGQTGGGKTLAATTVARLFFGRGEDTDRILVIDGNGYTDEESMLTLFGAHNGQASYKDTKGKIPDWMLRHQSYLYLIINEGEKAHPLLWRRLMELLDQKDRHGGLTAGDGSVIHGRHMMVVFTTNRGADEIFKPEPGVIYSDAELATRAKGISESEARGFFTNPQGYAEQDRSRLPPETVGRMRWIVAKPTSLDDALLVAEKEKAKEVETSRARHGLIMEVDPEVVETIARISFTLGDGNRPIRDNIRATLSRVRMLAWQLPQVAKGHVRVSIKKQDDGNHQIEILDHNQNDRLVAHFELKDPGLYMAVFNPRFRETLANLETDMAQDVFGQDEAVAEVARTYRSHALLRIGTQPVSALLIGLADNGQEEIAASLAKRLYGSANRRKIFDMGGYQDPQHLWTFFSPAKGYLGSGTTGPFEEYVRANWKEGGVIVLKDFTHMGAGKSAQERQAIYDLFSSILSRGQWTNIHGRTYDVSRFTFILTGDDGAEIYRNSPNEDLQLTEWKDHKGRHKVHKHLARTGISGGLLNSLGSLCLMKPLTREAQQKYFKRAFDGLNTKLLEQHGFKVKLSDQLIDRLAVGYSLGHGGIAAAQRFVAGPVADLISKAILTKHLSSAFDRSSIRTDLTLDLSYNFGDHPWAAEKKIKPEATLSIKGTFSAGESQPISIDESERLMLETPPVIETKERSESTAYHEAGHALVNLHTGEPGGPLGFLTVEGIDGEFAGYARYQFEDFIGEQDLDYYIRAVARGVAGNIAMEVNGIRRNSSWRDDLRQVRNQVMTAITRASLIPGDEFLFPIDKDELPDLSALSDAKRAALLEQGQWIVDQGIRLATEIMADPEVKEQTKRIVHALMEKGSISGKQFLDISGDYRYPLDKRETFRESCEKALRERFVRKQ